MKGLNALWHDVIFAARLLRKSPVFAGSVILTLALGIGVNTGVFAVVNAIVLRPLPVREGQRLVVIASQELPNRTLGGMSIPDLRDYREATGEVFDDVAAYSVGFLGLAVEGHRPERVLVTWVTDNYFPLLDVRPALGRVITGDEGGCGSADRCVLLGYTTWQRRFGGDRSAVGQTVKVNGQAHTVAGVTPPGFRGTFAFSDSELYLLLDSPPEGDAETRRARRLHAIARLRPGVTIARARAATDVVAERLARQYPDSNARVRMRVLPERLARPEEDQYRSNAVGAAIVLGLVGVVMIVAAVNVANLLLSRATSRRLELAIRAALGAGRGRLIRQLLTESLVLAALGGSLGVLLGTWVAHAFASIRPPGDLPVRLDFPLDARVLSYSVVVVLVTGLLVGLVPALRVSGEDLDRTLRQARGSPGTRSHRIRGVLVVAQIACCLVLLTAAGLFARSLFEAHRTDLGFRPDGVLNVHMDVGQLGYTEAQGRAFFDDVDRRVRSIPGVQAVSFAFTVPLGYIRVNQAVESEVQLGETSGRLSAGKNIVSADYFRTMGIRMVHGRSFGEADNEQSRPVAIVNQHLADRLWPGADPLGRRFKSGGPNASSFEVIGVTGTGKYQFLFEDPQAHFYVPTLQEYTALRVLQVRTSTQPEALAPAVERTIREIEPNLPLYDVQPMTRALGSGPGLFPVRVGAVAVASFALLAFLLAIVGLYGVVSYLTSQRTHEIGVRMAVGAAKRDIVRLVLQDGSKLVIYGIAAGLLLTLACSRILGRFLFGVSALDPSTILGVVAVLGAVTLVACVIPAWRAARVNPTTALRYE